MSFNALRNEAICRQLGHHARHVARGSGFARPKSAGFSKPALARKLPVTAPPRPTPAFAPDPNKTYTLAELVNLAEQNNPDTRVAWENAKARAADLGISKATLYPTVAAVAVAQSVRDNLFFAPNYYRQTV